MRSQQEIDDEIAKLREARTKVRPTTAFGDDNLAAIDAQIEALRKRMTQPDVHDAYGEDALGEDDFDQHILDSALEAAEWVWNGGAAPSEGWNP